MIEINRDNNETLDSLVKRFRRQVTKNKVLQEVKQRAFFQSEGLKNRLKKRRNERKGKGNSNKSNAAPRNNNQNRNSNTRRPQR